MVEARRRRTRRTFRPRPSCAASAVTVSTRSVAVTPSLSLPVEAEADHLRDQHGDRLAEHRRLGLDAADAPAEHAEPVDHGGVAVGADAACRDRRPTSPSCRVLVHTVCARYSRLTWWQMPVPGGTTRKLSKAPLAPAQERVALAVPLVFDLDIVVEGARRCRSRRPSPNGR